MNRGGFAADFNNKFRGKPGMMRVVIVGAGIGGLATALLCLQRGMSVTVLEQAPELTEVGAGVQISSNGTRVLGALGLLDQVTAMAVDPISLRMVGLDTGRLSHDIPLGATAVDRYGGPFYQIHRSDLLDILRRATPDGVIRLGVRAEGYEQSNDRVAVRLDTGELVHGDVLVGADGIKSAICTQMVGPMERSFSGYVAWRALIPAHRIQNLGLEERFYGWAGPGRMVFSYWVRKGELYNFGGVVPSDEIVAEDWGMAGDVQRLKASFKGAEPRLAAIVDAIDNAFVTGLFDKDPLDRLVDQRVALLGDAAHAMLPYLAQGACQALEDGMALARCLERRGPASIEQALLDYQTLRLRRVTRVQVNARASGEAYLLSDPRQAAARDGRFRGIGRLDPEGRSLFAWLYGHDVVHEPLPEDKGAADTGTPASEAEDSARRRWAGAFSPAIFAAVFDRFRSEYARPWRDKGGIAAVAAAGEHVDAGGVPALWFAEANADAPIILHLHAGLYALGSPASSANEANRIAADAGARLLSPAYRLAPEHPFPSAIDDVVSAYRWLLDQGHKATRIVLSGECAGAGLALAAALKLRDAGLPLPAGIVATSPFADLTLRSDTIDRNVDPLLDRDLLTSFAAAYFQSADPDDPLISPVLADLHGLPPLLIQAAQGSILLGDAEALAAAARAAGVKTSIHLYEGSFHAFASFPELVDTRRARETIAKFVQGCVSTERPVHA